MSSRRTRLNLVEWAAILILLLSYAVIGWAAFVFLNWLGDLLEGVSIVVVR